MPTLIKTVPFQSHRHSQCKADQIIEQIINQSSSFSRVLKTFDQFDRVCFEVFEARINGFPPGPGYLPRRRDQGPYRGEGGAGDGCGQGQGVRGEGQGVGDSAGGQGQGRREQGPDRRVPRREDRAGQAEDRRDRRRRQAEDRRDGAVHQGLSRSRQGQDRQRPATGE